MKRVHVIMLATFGIIFVSLGLGLGFGLSNEDEISTESEFGCINRTNSKCYSKAAVASDDERCSEIGSEILKAGGSAVDGMIAALLCNGVVGPYHSGIGGAAFFTIYEKNQEPVFINCREIAPENATKDMFKDNADAAMNGPLAIAVPGEIKCMKVAHDLFGKLPWNELFKPAINLARNGWEIYNYTASVMVQKRKYLEDPLYNWAPYLDANGIIKKKGDFVIDLELANTFEKIGADNTKDTFYTGDLSKEIADDLSDFGSIITLSDLESYRENISEPLISTDGEDTYLFPQAPSSGPILQLMLNIMKGFEVTESKRLDELTYHRIVETMKHGYAIRTGMSDPNFYGAEVDELVKKSSDEEFLQSIRNNITEKTHEINYYNPVYIPIEDDGTLHISALDENGQAASGTSTINLYFGSKCRGKRTGIIFNDGMDDFSTEGFENDFGVVPSPINFIQPNKRPVSSMCPTIIINTKTKEPKMMVGGSGGTKITSGVFQVILNKIRFQYSMGNSVNRQRLHHQLSPNQINWDEPTFDGEDWRQLIFKLRDNRGHELTPEEKRMVDDPITQAIWRHEDGTIEAASDPRHGGVPGGY